MLRKMKLRSIAMSLVTMAAFAFIIMVPGLSQQLPGETPGAQPGHNVSNNMMNATPAGMANIVTADTANPVTAGMANASPTGMGNATLAGMLNATPVYEAVPDVNVSIVGVSYLGDEWVTLANQGAAPADLSGWALTDGMEFRYTFPSLILPPGSVLRIHLGHGIETPNDLYLGLSGEMLDDTGDVVTLFDRSGAVVSRYTYPGVAYAPLQPVTPGLIRIPPVENVIAGMPPETGIQRGLLVQPGPTAQPSAGQQVQPSATSTYVTQLANVSAIFETNPSVNINITNVGIIGDEFIEVVNEGLVPMNMTGWVLRAGANFTYTFPQMSLPVGGLLRIHPGAGVNTHFDIYLNRPQPVMDDLRGEVILQDQRGTVISRHTYPASAYVPMQPAVPGLVRSPGTGPILVSGPVTGTPAVIEPGAEFLAAPVAPLTGVTGGRADQVISGQPTDEITGVIPATGIP